MRARTNKVQPLNLSSLLEMRMQLEKRLNALRADGVKSTDSLQGLYERCKKAIHQAQAEKRISSARYAAK